jgi:anti-sigma B factor antagonist
VTDGQWPHVRGADALSGFSVRTCVIDGAMVVWVAGELDLGTAPRLGDVLSRVCSTPVDRVLVDVSRLRFLGVAGLHMLVTEHNRLLSAGRNGLVVRGASGTTRRAFQITGLAWLLGDPEPTEPTSAVAFRGWQHSHGHDLEVGRRQAGLSVKDLFVCYFALGGTADLGQFHAYLSGSDDVLDSHQQDVAVHAVNELLIDLGQLERLLAYLSDKQGRS